MRSLLNTIGTIAAIYIALMAMIACSNPKGEFFYGTLGLGDKKNPSGDGEPRRIDHRAL